MLRGHKASMNTAAGLVVKRRHTHKCTRCSGFDLEFASCNLRHQGGENKSQLARLMLSVHLAAPWHTEDIASP